MSVNFNQFQTGQIPQQSPTQTIEHVTETQAKEQAAEALEQREDVQVNDDLMAVALKQANESLAKFDRYIQREVHEVTHSVMYKLMDNVTHEVISEFPERKIQDMVAKMWEMAGLFVDERA